ncbi:MAG: hypothetical protein LBE58_15375 [Comamonas sp.]|jgi:hypothetical protein|nr:hypothetical protein [Comamonas sp.]
MNVLLLKMMKRLNEAGESGSDAGGTGAAPAPAPAEDRGDVVDPELNASTLASLVGQDAGGEGAEAGEAGGESDEGAGAGQEADGAGEGGQGGRSAGIPPARFNEVNERRKQAEKDLAEALAEIERLRHGGSQAASPAPAPPAGAPAAPAAPAAAPAAPFDEDAQEQAYVSALIDGDPKRAAEIRKVINAHLRDEATKAAIQRADEQRQADHQQAVGRALAAETALTVEKYPYLDTAEGAEAVELIVAARDAKIAKGVPAHEALRAAVAAIAPRFAPASAAAATAPTPGKDSASAAAPADSRTSAAIARGAAASVAQPPALNGGVGDRANAGRVNVAQMTDEQFENLSPAEIKKLRGD